MSDGTGNGGWNHDVFTVTPGIPGDSGSGYMDADGNALGVVSTVEVAPFPAVHTYDVQNYELRSYTPPTGPTTTYDWDQIAVTDIIRGDEHVEITNDPDGRALQVSLTYSGQPAQTWTFAYGNWETQVVGPSGIDTLVRFSRDGRPLSTAASVWLEDPVPLSDIESAWLAEGVPIIAVAHTTPTGGGGHILDDEVPAANAFAAYRSYYDSHREPNDPIDPPITEVTLREQVALPALPGGTQYRVMNAQPTDASGRTVQPRQGGASFTHPDIALAAYESEHGRHMAQIVVWDDTEYPSEYGWEFNNQLFPTTGPVGCDSQFNDWWMEYSGSSYGHNFPPLARAYHEGGLGIGAAFNDCAREDFGVGVLWPDELVDGEAYVWEWSSTDGASDTSRVDVGSQFVRDDYVPLPGISFRCKNCMNLSAHVFAVPDGAVDQMLDYGSATVPICYGEGAAADYLTTAYADACTEHEDAISVHFSYCDTGPHTPQCPQDMNEVWADYLIADWSANVEPGPDPYTIVVEARPLGSSGLFSPYSVLESVYSTAIRFADLDIGNEYEITVLGSAGTIGLGYGVPGLLCWRGDPNPNCSVYVH